MRRISQIPAAVAAFFMFQLDVYDSLYSQSLAFSQAPSGGGDRTNRDIHVPEDIMYHTIEISSHMYGRAEK